MKSIFATLAVAALTTAVHGLGCGPGTVHDLATDLCVAVEARLPRAESAEGPRIVTEDGNVVIAVDGEGKQVGYRVGDGDVIFFDTMDKRLSGYTEGTVQALEMGYNLGKVDGGSNAVLEYLKTDLTDRVTAISDKQAVMDASVGSTLATATASIDAKMEAFSTKAAADAVAASTEISETVTTQLAAADAANDVQKEKVDALATTVASIDAMLKKTVECAAAGAAFNPIKSECCEVGASFLAKDKRCTFLGELESSPAKSCLEMFEKYKTSKANGLYWISGALKVQQIWCRFDGDYPGAGLMLRRPGRTNGMESITGARNLPCKHDKTGTNYCKLGDADITEYTKTSAQQDPYISLAYKNTGDRPKCRGYAAKTCVWSMSIASTNCNNAHKRNSKQYCRREQRTYSYRGLDGHQCGNLDYNSGNPHVGGDGGIAYRRNAFIIFEHSGGTHYCGGWDTTWQRIELWIQ